MFSLVIDEIIRFKIDLFLESFLNSNLKIFLNSWIENEFEILENYKNIAKSYRNEIYLKIEKIFSEEIIFQKIEKWRVTSSFSVWNFRFVIEFSEDKVEKIRFLENVEIYKK